MSETADKPCWMSCVRGDSQMGSVCIHEKFEEIRQIVSGDVADLDRI